jgi:DUF438 domain-containing protein
MEIDRLKEVLKGINKGVITENEALEEIKKATPLELSIAEQGLLDEGISPDELKKFCTIHLRALEDKLQEIKLSLDKGHPIHTMISEHEEILKFLDELDNLIEPLKRGISDEEKKILQDLSEHLVDAEKHHEREEKVLFPELEKRGITGPPRIMRMEHDELRPIKKRLQELSIEPDKNKNEIIELINVLSFKLRDHIFKENNILYPAALNDIGEDVIWENIKKECDNIGYCCFTVEFRMQC